MLDRSIGVLRVLTDGGAVRASYGPRMLAQIAKTANNAPEAGEWVSLCCWPDGVLTVAACLSRRTRPAGGPAPAPVLHLDAWRR